VSTAEIAPEDLQCFLNGPSSSAATPLCHGEIGLSTVLCDSGARGLAKVGDTVVFENGSCGIITSGREDVLINGCPAAIPDSLADGPADKGYVGKLNVFMATTTLDVGGGAIEHAGASRKLDNARKRAPKGSERSRNLSAMTPDEYMEDMQNKSRNLARHNRYSGTAGRLVKLGENIARGAGVIDVISDAHATNEALDKGEYGTAAYNFGRTMLSVASVIVPAGRVLKVVKILCTGKAVVDGAELGHEILTEHGDAKSSRAADGSAFQPQVTPLPTPNPAVTPNVRGPVPTPTLTPPPSPRPTPTP
jgi:hypothetical protein